MPALFWLLRFGIRAPIFVGMGLAAVALGLFAIAPAEGRYWIHVFPAMTLLGLGCGMALNPVLLAAMTTGLCLALGFPLAYYIARLSPRRQALWLVLIMIPFWTNFLVRTYAWIFILRTEGLLNTLLLQLHLIQAPLDLLYSNEAVLLGLVYGYLPFMVLPLYAAIERIDPALIEAAWDLYADRWSLFRLVLVPLTKPGIIAGCVLVFIPSLGAFLTPDLLGGARSMMAGNLIQHEYLVARDWPLGSALSLVLMVIVMGSLTWYFKAQAAQADERGGR